MRVLDLFSGIGGFSLGLHEAGMETVGFCEMDSFCQKVLKKHWPNVPIHADIKELDGHEYRGTVELVCGGFPCQPFSVAGKQGGAEDDRALWPEMLRVIREVQPTWVIGENVSGIIKMELDSVLSDLEAEGYATQTFVLPACAVDAKHRRDRVWIIAYANSEGEPDGSQHEQRLVADSDNRHWSRKNKGVLGKQSGEASDRFTGSSEDVADSIGEPRRSRTIHRKSDDQRRRSSEARREGVQSKDRQSQSNNSTTSGENVADSYCEGLEIGQGFGEHTQSELSPIERSGCEKRAIWSPEPDVGRVADGIPNRTHRLKSLGNAVVPQVVEQIGKAIMGMRNPSHLRTTGVDGRGR